MKGISQKNAVILWLIILHGISRGRVWGPDHNPPSPQDLRVLHYLSNTKNLSESLPIPFAWHRNSCINMVTLITTQQWVIGKCMKVKGECVQTNSEAIWCKIFSIFSHSLKPCENFQDPPVIFKSNFSSWSCSSCISFLSTKLKYQGFCMTFECYIGGRILNLELFTY